MPQRILRRSAELLDETDDLTRRMDVQIFQQENGVDYSVDGWVPGDPIYVHPHRRDHRTEPQHARPIFQLHYVLPALSTGMWTDPETGEEYEVETYREGRCSTCHVDWEGNTPCWVCGKHTFGNSNLAFGEPFTQTTQDMALLDRFGFIAKPLTAAQEMRLNNGRDPFSTDIIFGDEFIGSLRRPERPRRGEITIERNFEFVAGSCVPYYNLIVDQEAISQFPMRIWDRLEQDCDHHDWDIDLNRQRYFGVPEPVWEWFQDQVERQNRRAQEQWNMYGAPEHPAITRVRYMDSATEFTRIPPEAPWPFNI